MNKDIKCKYCKKPYPSPSVMRSKKCRYHPKGMWGGWCEPNAADEFLWGLYNQQEKRRKAAEEQEQENRRYEAEKAEFLRNYKKHTPLLDCMLHYHGAKYSPEGAGISEFKFEIRNSDLNQLSLSLANGMNEQSRDAINTIYALRAGCEYVLNNPEAQDEGKLNTWTGKIALLKDEVAGWDFWNAVYWLTKSVKPAEEFHVTRVMPMLRVTRGEGGEKELKIKEEIKSSLQEARANYKSFERNIDSLIQRIDDYNFWGILYCLYWMKLRPTPWDDKKVWPIQTP